MGTRSVASAAETYLLGLFASPKSNMLSMSERMLEADYQVLHHMLSDSEWDFDGLVSETSRQVNALIGGKKAALLIDESAFAKKGEASAGVARQWNGRLGKVENSQVGVFAALAKETAVSLIDARLYLPECWLNDTARLDAVEVPTSARVAQTKVELAREMIFARGAMGYVSDMWPSMQSMAVLGGCCENSTMKGSPSWGRCAVTSTSSCETRLLRFHGELRRWDDPRASFARRPVPSR